MVALQYTPQVSIQSLVSDLSVDDLVDYDGQLYKVRRVIPVGGFCCPESGARRGTGDGFHLHLVPLDYEPLFDWYNPQPGGSVKRGSDAWRAGRYEVQFLVSIPCHREKRVTVWASVEAWNRQGLIDAD